MKKIKGKIHIFLVCSALILQFVFSGCKSSNPEEIISGKMSDQVDDSIYLTSFPSDVYLELGKSVLIENGNTIFRFIEVLEYSVNNSAVRLQIDYDNGVTKTIVLNTVNIPQTYTLENGYNYMIQLKEVNQIDYTYRIMFTYNRYGGL